MAGGEFRLILLGWIVSRFLLSPLKLIEVGPFYLLVDFVLVAIWCISLSVGLANGVVRRRSILFMAGLIADAVPYWMLRPGSGTAPGVGGPFETSAWHASLLSLAVVAAFWALSRHAASRSSVIAPHRKRSAAMTVGAAVATVAAYRLSMILLSDLPNEDRSLIVKGVELHHAYQATFLLALFALAADRWFAARAFWVALASGVLAGSILDQISYVTLVECTDEAYLAPVSTAGALIATGAFAAALLISSTRSPAHLPVNN